MKELVIVYYSKTGQTQRFLEKLREQLEIRCYRLTDSAKFACHAPFVLVTPTYDFGQAPEQVQAFLEDEVTNRENMVAVVSSGDTSWGKNKFARSGDLISEQYGVPLLHKYELRGNSNDLEKIVDGLNRLRGDIS